MAVSAYKADQREEWVRIVGIPYKTLYKGSYGIVSHKT